VGLDLALDITGSISHNAKSSLYITLTSSRLQRSICRTETHCDTVKAYPYKPALGNCGIRRQNKRMRTGPSSPLLTVQGGEKCGKSSDFWNNYETDIARVASLNSNSFRLSLEWSRIEPNRGQTCPEGVERYHAIFDCLERYPSPSPVLALLDLKIGRLWEVQLQSSPPWN
jgi:hypothetical protein